jgi:hypothetical protein
MARKSVVITFQMSLKICEVKHARVPKYVHKTVKHVVHFLFTEEDSASKNLMICFRSWVSPVVVPGLQATPSRCFSTSAPAGFAVSGSSSLKLSTGPPRRRSFSISSNSSSKSPFLRKSTFYFSFSSSSATSPLTRACRSVLLLSPLRNFEHAAARKQCNRSSAARFNMPKKLSRSRSKP